MMNYCQIPSFYMTWRKFYIWVSNPESRGKWPPCELKPMSLNLEHSGYYKFSSSWAKTNTTYHTFQSIRSDLFPRVKYRFKNDASNLRVDYRCGACAAFKWGYVFMFTRKAHTGFRKSGSLVMWNLCSVEHFHRLEQPLRGSNKGSEVTAGVRTCVGSFLPGLPTVSAALDW